MTDDAAKDKYCDKLIDELKKWGAEISRPISSVYIGGGTPTVLGGVRLEAILNAVNSNFSVLKDAEITVEGNPGDNLTEIIPKIKAAGCNRFSLGVQSANDSELKTLGRRHSPLDAKKAVEVVRKCGIDNISVDLMLGLPESSDTTLKKSIDFALSLSPMHISAYILKLEDGTPLKKQADSLNLPDDDAVSDQYLLLCKELEKAGYEHYEISNFAKSDYHSRHNTSYWQCEEYIGVGPAAHSFFECKRFYYPPDIAAFLDNPQTVYDGEGGTPEEYIMLGLRLKSGISATEFENKFGRVLSPAITKKAKELQKNGLCDIIDGRISLTDSGMLVSNSIINYFLEEL